MMLDQSFTYKLHTLHKLTDIQTQRAYERHSEMSLSDGRCLSVIAAFGPLSVNDLAFKSNLNKAQASRAAQSLVERKLVLKDLSATDKRGVVLSLTATGKKTVAKVFDIVAQRNVEILAALSPKEQQQVHQLFDRLIISAQKSLEQTS
jgi:DNA-binding MarR family transcriptional regulator